MVIPFYGYIGILPGVTRDDVGMIKPGSEVYFCVSF